MTPTATLVTGPPCSGKNTYVARCKQPGDLVVDFDALIMALGGDESHNHPGLLKGYAFEARDAVIRRWAYKRDTDVWVIGTCPRRSDREKFTRQGFRVVTMDADEKTCVQRARAERPVEWLEYVHRYFQQYEAPLDSEGVLSASDVPPIASVSRRW